MIAYLRSVFSSENAASFARWSTAATVVTGCISVLHVSLTTHHLPDGGALAGMGAFMVAPYAINKAAAAISKTPDSSSGPGRVDSIEASANHPTRTEAGVFLRRS